MSGMANLGHFSGAYFNNKDFSARTRNWSSLV